MIFEMRMLWSAKKRAATASSHSICISDRSLRTISLARSSLCRSLLDLPVSQPWQVERRRPQIGHLLNLPVAHVPYFAQPAGVQLFLNEQHKAPRESAQSQVEREQAHGHSAGF